MRPEDGIAFVLEQSLLLQHEVRCSLLEEDTHVHLNRFLAWLQQVYSTFIAVSYVAAEQMRQEDGTYVSTYCAAYLNCIRVVREENRELDRFLQERGLRIAPNPELYKIVAYGVTERPQSLLLTRAFLEKSIRVIGPEVMIVLRKHYGLESTPAWLLPHLEWEEYVVRFSQRLEESHGQLTQESKILQAAESANAAVIAAAWRRYAA